MNTMDNFMYIFINIYLWNDAISNEYTIYVHA